MPDSHDQLDEQFVRDLDGNERGALDLAEDEVAAELAYYRRKLAEYEGSGMSDELAPAGGRKE
jgi:hypothetical protein